MPFSISAADLLARIPLSAHTVLDVGCGDGDLLAAYRRLNPRARLLGIAADAVAAAHAAPGLTEVATVDVEAQPMPFTVPGGIDCIVYNDVLHRLRDPWDLMRRHAEALSPGGIMLICVQNPDHWRVTERRLRGAAVDDRGHESWPDPAGVEQRLRGVGLVMCDMTTRKQQDDAAGQAFFAALAPALSALDIDAEAYAERAAASHLIYRVSKEPTRPMILSGSMLNPVGGVSHVRVVHPLRAVGSDPSVTTAVTDQIDRRPSPDSVPRIFVLHRPALIHDQALGTVRRLGEAGYLTVTEFDDHPDHFRMMRMGGDLGFRGVHALQTSTAAMAEILRQYNPEVAVFPNAVVSLPDVRNFAVPGRLTLFFGALNRERDWQNLMPVINAVAAEAGERMRFEVIHDRLFFDALETPHKNFTPTCDYDTYLRLLGGSELCFMPLGDTAFNRAKSDLKFIEAGSCRVATLASTVVYGDSVEDGRTGLLFRDPSEFDVRLRQLVARPDLARDLGEAARRYVADHRMLAYQVAPRIAWYRSLWARRNALEAARRARVERRMAA